MWGNAIFIFKKLKEDAYVKLLHDKAVAYAESVVDKMKDCSVQKMFK